MLQIASDGWRLLPFYQINPKSGQFVHRSFERFDKLRSLSELQFGDGVCRYSVPCQETGAPNHDKVLMEARIIYDKADQAIVETLESPDEDYSAPASATLYECEWWCTPSVAAAQLRKNAAPAALSSPRLPA